MDGFAEFFSVASQETPGAKLTEKCSIGQYRIIMLTALCL